MRPLVLYITASIDGYIADTEGGVGWLAGAEGEDYGFSAFMAEVDTLLMGSHTWLDTLELSEDDPYEGKRVIVFTSREDLPARGGVEFVHADAVSFTRDLVAGEGGPVWLVGGGELASTLVSAGLVDELRLFVQPVVLGDGIALWRAPLERRWLELVRAHAWPGHLVELHYRFAPRP